MLCMYANGGNSATLLLQRVVNCYQMIMSKKNLARLSCLHLCFGKTFNSCNVVQTQTPRSVVFICVGSILGLLTLGHKSICCTFRFDQKCTDFACTEVLQLSGVYLFNIGRLLHAYNQLTEMCFYFYFIFFPCHFIQLNQTTTLLFSCCFVLECALNKCCNRAESTQ